MEKKDLVLTDNFTLWYHDVNNDDYSLKSYQKLMDINEYDDILYMLKKIKNINSGMFFLMRSHITPLWENKYNKKGGFWTFKVSKQNSYNMWCELLLNFCINYLSNDDKQITGISVSPKINNCIFKIWNNDKFNNDIKFLRDDLEYMDLNEGLYRPHKY